MAMKWLFLALYTIASLANEPSTSCRICKGCATDCAKSPVVNTTKGPVQGFDRVVEGATVSTFWGIPFAEPPVGTRRFHYPQPLSKLWHETLDAIQQSVSCPHSSSSANSDEDCLYLNVYTPRSAIANAALPVMFYIYGGGFRNGDAYQPLVDEKPVYDGAPLAGRHGVVIVTSNYRTNVLGFNTYTRGPHGETGSQAMADQRLALQWTNDNIAGFGGDRSRVTIFGESAGAFSIMYHLVSPPSWPYFSKAIMESGTSKSDLFFQPKQEAEQLFSGWAAAVGCPQGLRQLSCLQRLPASAFVHQPKNYIGRSPAYELFPVGPVIDGNHYGLLGVPVDLVKQGLFAKVPLLIGANKDDGRLFVPLLTGIVPGISGKLPTSHVDNDLAMKWFFGTAQEADIWRAYPDVEFTRALGNVSDAYQMQFSRMLRDNMFQCSNRALVTEWLRHGLDAFLYTFSFGLGRMGDWSLGDYHAVELPFVWRNHLWIPERVRSSRDVKRMSNIMSCLWTTFAYAGNPNGNGSVALMPHNCTNVHGVIAPWPKFDTDRQYYALTELPIAHFLSDDNRYPDDEFPSDAKCDVWDKTSFNWHALLGGAVEAPLIV